MKKFLALLLALTLVFALCACGSGSDGEDVADTTAADTTDTTDTADAADTTTAEFTTVTEGIDVEIAQAIADKLGLELVVDDMDFDAALLAAQNGKSDIIMAGVTVTDERKLVMEFSDSYSTGVQVVIVKEGSDVTIDNLGDQTIGTQRGTTGNIYCTDDYGEDHVVAYDNGITAVQALLNGQVDCVVIDSAPAQEFVAANEGLTILDTEYVTEDYAIGMAKGNTALLDAVNTALKELQDDGTVQSIVDKYINAD
jgi:polar amino acid transport system substrate-binding protein